MNANEYINGMADLIRTTGADVRIEDIDGKKRVLAANAHDHFLAEQDRKEGY